MAPDRYTVFIVEDDASVRDALALLLGLRGYPVAVYADAESLLAAWRPEHCGCLLIDIRMPAIVMTGHGDIDAARNAFRAQAVDFLEKPIDQERLMQAIEEAFARQGATQEDDGRRLEFGRLLAGLTPREREVVDLVVAGRHNREIAEALGISARTVEVHKARAMAKLRVENIPDLVRLNLLVKGG